MREIESLLDELASLGTLFLTITGGEPAIRRDLEDIVAAASERRFSVMLKTSGTLLDDKRVEALAEAGLRQVDVSVYDDRPDEHDLFVGMSGAWRKTEDVLKRFSALGVVAKASVIATRDNADRVLRIVDWCEQFGFAYAVTTRIYAGVDGNRTPCSLRIEADQLERLLEDPRLFDSKELLERHHVRAEGAFCAAGSGTAHIWPDGRIGLCPIVPLVLGNIRERSFRELWIESTERKQFVETTWSDVQECHECPVAWACKRCPGAAMVETGSLVGVSAADCNLATVSAKLCLREREE